MRRDREDMQGQWNFNGYETPPRIQWTPPKRKMPPGRVAAIVAGVVALLAVVGVTVLVSWPDGDGRAAEPGKDDTAADKSEADSNGGADPGAYPGAGDYRVVHDDTGLCLTTGPEIGNEERDVIVLGDCDKTYPEAMTWEPVGDHRYTVGLAYTKDNWNACLTADEPADEMGYLFAGQDCEKKNGLQSFELTGKGDGKYGITVAGTAMCVGPLQEPAEDGVAISTVKCSDGGTRSFTLEKS